MEASTFRGSSPLSFPRRTVTHTIVAAAEAAASPLEKSPPFTGDTKAPQKHVRGDISSEPEATTSPESDQETISVLEDKAMPADAVAVAADKEKMAAIRRIETFIVRRWRGWSGEPSAVATMAATIQAGAESETKATAAAVPMSAGKGGIWWLDSAIRSLTQVVDEFLRGDSSSTHSTANSKEPRLVGTVDESTGSDTQTSADSKVPTGDYRGSSEDPSSSPIETSRESIVQIDDDKQGSNDDDDGWPVFPPVPLRARAPSLYTLASPGNSRKNRTERGGGAGGGDGVVSTDDAAQHEPETTIFPSKYKLEADVSARLSSARSVFGLRASDVLSAFPLPPPSGKENKLPLPLKTMIRWRRVATPATILDKTPPARTISGFRGSLFSPDVLRRRLRSEGYDAARAGLRLPWDFPHQGRLTSAPGRRRPRSASPKRSSNIFNCIGGDNEGARDFTSVVGNTKCDRGGMRTSHRFGGSLTNLGRRLLQKRRQLARDRRRRQFLGVTDAARFRHAGKQLRSVAAMRALDEILRFLDRDALVAREKNNLPEEHVEKLLGLVDRLALTGSQQVRKREGL